MNFLKCKEMMPTDLSSSISSSKSVKSITPKVDIKFDGS